MPLLPRPAVRAACALLLLSAACDGQDDRSTAATSTVAATTTKPPPTAAELAWLEGLVALRERLEERTQPRSGEILTQSKRREFIVASRSCTPGLAELGAPSPRLQRAHRTAQAGCRFYERSAKAWVDAGDWMAVGDVGQVQKYLSAATDYRGDALNRLLLAEIQAERALG